MRLGAGAEFKAGRWAEVDEGSVSMDYIRSTYGVPAKRDCRIAFLNADKRQEGTIVWANGAYLRVRMDGERRLRLLHPTWRVEYLP